MNISELFFDGMTKADVDHAFAVLEKLKKNFERIAGRIRPMRYLAAVIERADLKTFEGVLRLGAHVRANWSCREISYFRSFLHGGRFVPASGKWWQETAGLTFETAKEDSNLDHLWQLLLTTAHFFIGAAAVFDLRGAKVLPGIMQTDEGDGPSLWDMTIDELARVVPEEKKKKLDVIARLEEQRCAINRVERMMAMNIHARGEYAVSAQMLSEMMERRNCKRSARTIQLWEEYLKTGGEKGTKPPTTYNLDVRLTAASANAWVEPFANEETARLRTRCSFERVQHRMGK